MDLARVGGKTKWMEALAGEGEGFREWDCLVEGSPRWIRLDLEETSVVMAGRAEPKTSSLDLAAWARAAGVEGGTRVGETEGTEVGMEVPGGMTIVIVSTTEEVTTEVGEVVTVNAGGEVEEAVVEDTKPYYTHF